MKTKKARKRVSSNTNQIKQLKKEIVDLQYSVRTLLEFRELDKQIDKTNNSIFNRNIQEEIVYRKQDYRSLTDRIDQTDAMRIKSDSDILAQMVESDDRIEYLVLTLDKIVLDMKAELKDFLTARLQKEAMDMADERLNQVLSSHDVKKGAARLQGLDKVIGRVEHVDKDSENPVQSGMERGDVPENRIPL